ncbi:hypothetical protein [Kitasatospora camelliae]|uniref:Uncharacterized protein n=1 Tax=Kitasatospora camelliae TaxID=3156397 RepID=A0AAU8K889_9ACTN
MDVDPLAVLSTSALSEGVRFLFDQARSLLDRRRRDRAAAEASAEESAGGVVQLPPEAFTGSIDTRSPDEAALAEAAPALRALRAELFPYIDAPESIRPGDADLLRLVRQLRQVLEAVYGQRITFATEAGERDVSGTRVDAFIDIAEIAGKVTAVEAGRISGGQFRVKVHSERVEPGGEVTGVRAEDIGT